MPLDPVLVAILKQAAEAGAPALSDLSPDDGRAMYLAMNEGASKVDVAEIKNADANGVPVRIYRPKVGAILPCLVYYHGGGWVIGDLETHDAPCRLLASETGCVVISVDYRLAPEFPFPVPLDDCYSATQWVFDHADELKIDADNIAVGGDSAGGNLAAAVCLKARDTGGPNIVHQLLIYPVTDGAMNTQSYQDNAEGYMLTKDSMAYFWDHYADSETRKDPLASPLNATNLANLPSTTLLTAEYDPLRDEGEAYADKLKKAGVNTFVKRYDGLVHGFISMTDVLEDARESINLMAAQLRIAFND